MCLSSAETENLHAQIILFMFHSPEVYWGSCRHQPRSAEIVYLGRRCTIVSFGHRNYKAHFHWIIVFTMTGKEHTPHFTVKLLTDPAVSFHQDLYMLHLQLRGREYALWTPKVVGVSVATHGCGSPEGNYCYPSPTQNTTQPWAVEQEFQLST